MTKKNFLLILTLILAALPFSGAWAQQKTVTGVVISSVDELPVVGANVVVVGTTVGTITDMDGKFTLNVPSSAKMLKLTYIGMQTKQVPIRNEYMKIMLEEDSKALDEVMVVAYGTAKKGTFTGSASVVNLDKINDRPTTEVTSALLGASSGVNVQSATGEPGAASTIRIRGVGSYSASNDPLIVLDGVIYDGTMNNLNPADIESITVLKDASSTALYGARAANGVLMINTKKGENGKLKFTGKFNQGFTSRQGGDYNRLGQKDYLETYWKVLRNNYAKDGSADPATAASQNLKSLVGYNPYNVAADQMVLTDGKLNPNASLLYNDFDWEDACLRQGSRTDANASISGGTNKATYYGSVGYTDEKGYVQGASYKRFTGTMRASAQVTNWMKLSFSDNYTYTDGKGQMSTSRGSASNTFYFLRYITPISPIYLHDPETGAIIKDENGDPYYDFGTGYKGADKRAFGSGTSNNPAIELRNRQRDYYRERNIFKGTVEIKLPFDLKFTFNGSMNSANYRYATASYDYPGKDVSNTSSKTNSSTQTWVFNELLNYQKEIGKHTIDAMIGHESYKYKYSYLNASMKDLIMEGNTELTNYTTINDLPSSYVNTYRTEGYFFRASYSYDNRYFLSGSVRRDGSSRFSTDSRWGTFWSVGAGWRIDEESFLKDVEWMDMLKLRLSYGIVGNDDLSSYYPYKSTYSSLQHLDAAGYVIGNLGNTDLEWEESRNFDIALEFNFLKNIHGSLEYFNRESSNLLFAVPLSLSSGSSSINMNAGTMYNRGVEFNIGADIVKTTKFRASADFNITYLKNKVTSLPIDAFIDNYVYRVAEGHSRYEFYLRQWAGVDPETGNSIYVPSESASESNLVTVNGKEYTTALTDAAYDYSGDGIAPWSGGLTLNLGYKQFNLSATIAYQWGGKMYDNAYYQLMYPNYNSGAQNLSTDILKAWENPGDQTCVPRLASGSDNVNLMGEWSTRWLVSNREIDLATFTFSYSIPRRVLKPLGIGSVKLYVSGENICSLTARKGLFPRLNEGGFNYNPDTYAPSRAFTFGINFNF